MDYQLQVITLPVTDVDKAAAFYTRQVGFTLDVDYHPTPGFRVVQLTPPGSACSIQIGIGLTDAPPGLARAIYLAVTDIEAARQELTGCGVTVSGIRHQSPIGDWKGGWQPGTDPERRDYASAADFADPDGNTWVLQEIGYRPPRGGGSGQPLDLFMRLPRAAIEYPARCRTAAEPTTTPTATGRIMARQRNPGLPQCGETE